MKISLFAVAIGALLGSGPTAHEARVHVGTTGLYTREIGHGRPVIVVHGGPDFDHRYLLPDMDRLSDAYRLIYYDQRGRGQSAAGVRPDDVTIQSDVADLDAVRQHFHLPATAVLGHSWGAQVALEYAVAHPDRVTRLVLMNPGPASHEDFLAFRQSRVEKLGGNLDRLKAIASGDAYKRGDPSAVADYYRILFTNGLVRPADLDKLVASLKASFTPEGVLKARAVEAHLLEGTWGSPSWNLLPKLRRLQIPTLVIYSDHDFIPEMCARHIAQALPNARLVTIRKSGHFPYMERPVDARRAIDRFFLASKTGASRPPDRP